MSKYVGRAFLLQLEDTPGAFVDVAGQLTTGCTLSNEQIDVTDKDGSGWRQLLPGGVRDFALRSRGLVQDVWSHQRLQELATSGEIARFRVLFSDGNWLTAQMQVLSYSGEGEYEAAQQYDVSLVSADDAGYANSVHLTVDDNIVFVF